MSASSQNQLLDATARLEATNTGEDRPMIALRRTTIRGIHIGVFIELSVLRPGILMNGKMIRGMKPVIRAVQPCDSFSDQDCFAARAMRARWRTKFLDPLVVHGR